MGEYELKQEGEDTVISVGSRTITVLLNKTLDSTLTWFNSNFKNARCKIT